MITKSKTLFYFRTVDGRVFFNQTQAQDHENQIIQEFNQLPDLRKIVQVGETWYHMDFSLGQMMEHGTFKVVQVEALKILIIREDGSTFTKDFSNWHQDYLFQILSSIEKYRSI